MEGSFGIGMLNVLLIGGEGQLLKRCRESKDNSRCSRLIPVIGYEEASTIEVNKGGTALIDALC